MDGWGTVTTPKGPFPCLRQNVLKRSVDSTWAKIVVGTYHYWTLLYGDTSATRTYSYISNITGGPIVEIELWADSATAIYEVRWNSFFQQWAWQNKPLGYLCIPEPGKQLHHYCKSS